MEKLEEALEQFVPTNQDQKGRVFGYVVGFRGVVGSSSCYAWVQRSVMDKNGRWKDWGPSQRSKLFKSKPEARAWAFAAMRERAEKAGLTLVGYKKPGR